MFEGMAYGFAEIGKGILLGTGGIGATCLVAEQMKKYYQGGLFDMLQVHKTKPKKMPKYQPTTVKGIVIRSLWKGILVCVNKKFAKL